MGGDQRVAETCASVPGCSSDGRRRRTHPRSRARASTCVWTRIITSALLIGGLVLNGSCATSPKGADADATQTGDLQELRIGRALAARLVRKYGLVRDQNLTRYVNLVGASIARVSSRPELQFHFAVLDTDEVNAFACPGGYVLLTRGAIQLMRDEAELAAVLAHEISHVALHYQGKFQARETSWTEFVVGFLAGGNLMTAAFNKVTSDLEEVMLERGRQKQLEFEADEAGLIYMKAVGFAPEASLDFLTRMMSSKKSEVRVRTHPPTEGRIRGMLQFIKVQELSREGVRNGDRFRRMTSALRTSK